MIKVNPAYQEAYLEYTQARDKYHYLVMVCETDPTDMNMSEKNFAYMGYMQAQNKVDSIPQTIEEK